MRAFQNLTYNDMKDHLTYIHYFKKVIPIYARKLETLRDRIGIILPRYIDLGYFENLYYGFSYYNFQSRFRPEYYEIKKLEKNRKKVFKLSGSVTSGIFTSLLSNPD